MHRTRPNVVIFYPPSFTKTFSGSTRMRAVGRRGVIAKQPVIG